MEDSSSAAQELARRLGIALCPICKQPCGCRVNDRFVTPAIGCKHRELHGEYAWDYMESVALSERWDEA